MGWEIAMILRKYFHRNMSFRDPQIEGTPKSAIGIEFPLCCNSFLSIKTQLNFSFRKRFTWNSFFLENGWFCVLRHNCHSLKIFKNVFFDISCYQNWVFSVKTSSSSKTKTPNENITPVKQDIIEKRLILIFRERFMENYSHQTSKWCFTLNTGSISLMRVTISNHTLRQKNPNQISGSWFFASKSGLSQKSFFFQIFRFLS